MIASRRLASALALLCVGMLSACGGSGSGDSTDTPTSPGTVPPPPAPSPTPSPTLTLTAAPTSINSGSSATLSWSTTNAASCAASGAWNGSKATSGTATLMPTQDSTYTLDCTGDGGSISRSVTITVTAVGNPTVSLSASPSNIAPSQSATLTWSSSNVDSCTASGGWSGAKSTSGSQSVTPAATASFTLTCSGVGGSANATASITVTATPPPATGGDLYVSPTGNDSNSGSASQPFATIQKAANVAQAGDVVSIAAGTYTGFTVTRSGTQSNRIEFIANGVVNLRQASNGYGVYINNASYITIDGFSIANTTSKGIAARGATPDDPMNGLIIRNNDISDTQEEGMYLSEVANSVIENNSLSNVGKAGVQTTGHGIYLANAGSKNTTIRGNTFSAPTNSWGEGLHVNGDASVGGDGIISGLVVENNRFLGGFNNGLSLDGVQNSDFRNNIIIDTHHHGIRAYGEDGAQGPKGLRIVNNTISAPAGNAVKTSEDSGASIVFNNILSGRDGATSFGTAATTASNLSTFAASLIDFLPTAAAIGAGVNSLAGVSAPATDLNGKTRTSPPDIGAVQH